MKFAIGAVDATGTAARFRTCELSDKALEIMREMKIERGAWAIVIALITAYPRWIGQKQLAKAIGRSAGAVQRWLQSASKAGLIVQTKEWGPRQVNPEMVSEISDYIPGEQVAGMRLLKYEPMDIKTLLSEQEETRGTPIAQFRDLTTPITKNQKAPAWPQMLFNFDPA